MSVPKELSENTSAGAALERQDLLEMSRLLLEERGWQISPPGECAKLSTGDLMAFGPDGFLVVWITTPPEAFALWMELLGNATFRQAMCHPLGPMAFCFQVHVWDRAADGKARCTVRELQAEDFQPLDEPAGAT